MAEEDWKQISPEEATRLHTVLFGVDLAEESEWMNRSIRFSQDPDNELCLLPVSDTCGLSSVAAVIQAFILKQHLFSDNIFSSKQPTEAKTLRDISSPLTEVARKNLLARSMAEVLFLRGNGERIAIANLNFILSRKHLDIVDEIEDEVITNALSTAANLQQSLRFKTCTSADDGAHAVRSLLEMLPAFETRVGALLFLVSVLLSGGLEIFKDDCNLSSDVDCIPKMMIQSEVGYLVFSEPDQGVKHPKWPIWVLRGETSDYTIMFAVEHLKVEDVDEEQKDLIRLHNFWKAMGARSKDDFIDVENLEELFKEFDIHLPGKQLEGLCRAGFVHWTQINHVVGNLPKVFGGWANEFYLYHSYSGSKDPLMREGGGISGLPLRLVKIRVKANTCNDASIEPEVFQHIRAVWRYADCWRIGKPSGPS